MCIVDELEILFKKDNRSRPIGGKLMRDDFSQSVKDLLVLIRLLKILLLFC